MIKCIAFLSVRNGKKSLKVLCTMWIVPCKTTMYEKVKNFGTIGRVEQKKYANTVFLKRSRYVLCYNVNNLQKNFVPVCCSLWLPKRTADTTIKPVHPYRNNLFLYREVRNWFCRRLQEAETHIFLIENWCFYGCCGQKCECKQPKQKYFFFPNLHLQYIKFFSWPYNQSLACYVVCKAIRCMFMEETANFCVHLIWTLFFSELKKSRKICFW